MTVEHVDTIDVRNTLGEGVLWDARRQRLWWTDIEESTLFELDPGSGELQRWETPYRVACFGFLANDDALLVAFDDGLAIYDVREGVRTWLVARGFLAPGLRFNDGRTGPDGRFWVGSMVEDKPATVGSAALYCLEDGHLESRVDGITISNGLCWSRNGRTMYHADSVKRSIRQYHYDPATGSPTSPAEFAATPEGVYPDGAVVDTGDGVWNARWAGGQVVRHTPDGEIDVVIDVPATQPTCVAFGGADLDLLFVTSARTGLSEAELEAEPAAGALFVYRTGFRGDPASLARVSL